MTEGPKVAAGSNQRLNYLKCDGEMEEEISNNPSPREFGDHTRQQLQGSSGPIELGSSTSQPCLSIFINLRLFPSVECCPCSFNPQVRHSSHTKSLSNVFFLETP